ncbi:MAG: glycosyltransferase, partial [Bacteroidota bacterium]
KLHIFMGSFLAGLLPLVRLDGLIFLIIENCFAFVYPSLFEGFGLPVLEAMNLGAPVIASNASALPEIIGSAGILVEPNDEVCIFRAMLALLCGEINPQELRARSILRAQQFSWEHTAWRVLDAYHAVVKKNKKGESVSASQT